MKKTIRLLALLALAQVALALIGYHSSTSLVGAQAGTPMLAFDVAAVDTVEIQGPTSGDESKKASSIVLRKQDGKWRLADGFPADASHVRRFLQKLHALKHGLPVATSEDAQARFRVSEKAHERKIMLRQGDKLLATLYMGKGAGLRQSYLRGEGDSAVYAAELASYEAPLTADRWQDETLLQLEVAGISELELDGLHIARRVEGGQATGDQPAKTDAAPAQWAVAPMPAGKQLDTAALDELLDKIGQLRFDSVLGRKPKSEYRLEPPKKTFSLVYKGKRLEYRIGERSDGGQPYVLKRSDREEYFQLDHYVGESLLKAADKARLLKAAEAAMKTTPGGTTDQGGGEGG